MDNLKSIKLNITPTFVECLFKESKFALVTDVIITKEKVEFITHTPDFSFYRISSFTSVDLFSGELPEKISDSLWFSFHSDSKTIKRLRGRLNNSYELQTTVEVNGKRFIAQDKLTFLLTNSLIKGDEFSIDLNNEFDSSALKLTLKYLHDNKDKWPLLTYKMSSWIINILKHLKADNLELYSPGIGNGNSLLIIINMVEFIGYPCSIEHDDKMTYLIKGALKKLDSSQDYEIFAYKEKAVFVECATGITNTFTSIEIIN
ncbi:hypothetical protein MASR1M45_02840 [Candidatus Kapaibacterium sp.]